MHKGFTRRAQHRGQAHQAFAVGAGFHAAIANAEREEARRAKREEEKRAKASRLAPRRFSWESAQ